MPCYTQPMVVKNTFGSRILLLKANQSFGQMSDFLASKGVNISIAGIHKWTKEGGISPENLSAVARAYGVSKIWLYFGEEEESTNAPEKQLLDLFRAATTIGKQKLLQIALIENQQLNISTESLINANGILKHSRVTSSPVRNVHHGEDSNETTKNSPARKKNSFS